MNGFAAPDTAAGICSAAIKRGFAAPSPDFPAHNFIFSESNLRKILDSTEAEEYAINEAEKLNSIFTVLLHSHGTIFATLTNGKKKGNTKQQFLTHAIKETYYI